MDTDDDADDWMWMWMSWMRYEQCVETVDAVELVVSTLGDELGDQ